jgi:tetrahydromethanopterin S-methyltransferase subunit D
MQTILRNSFVGLVVSVLLATPLFAQSVHRVPEGGSELAYAAVAGVSCLGAIWYRVRRKMQ